MPNNLPARIDKVLGDLDARAGDRERAILRAFAASIAKDCAGKVMGVKQAVFDEDRKDDPDIYWYAQACSAMAHMLHTYAKEIENG